MLQGSWLVGALVCAAFRRRLLSQLRVLAMGSACNKHSTMMDEGFDVIVGKNQDLPDDSMKEVKLFQDPPTSILLVKQKGKISALSNKCTHYGAPLVKGSLSTDTGIVRCPWHGACFNATTGDIEDSPGLDSLRCFGVIVSDDGDIHVTGSKSLLGKGASHPVIAAPLKEEDKTIVIVGGGATASACAETLRARANNPWKGRIVMIGQEACLPYDRPKLSKALTSTAQDLQLRSETFYQSAKITTHLGERVTNVDPKEQMVRTDKGTEIKYDYLVLATGGKPRSLSVPGAQLKNIYQLRSPQDGNAIVEKARNKNVVVVGSSFIGTEVAAYLADKAASVTMICRTNVPLENCMGKDIGSYVKSLHESKGVKIISNAQVVSFEGDDEVRSVQLSGGHDHVLADVVILGIGVQPTTDYLENVDLDEQGNVLVNDFLQSNVDNIFAGGDIARFPLDLPTIKTKACIGHWQVAQYHGRLIGLNIGQETMQPLRTVPFFWTVQYGKSLRFAGYVPSFDDILYEGDVSEGSFVAYYCQGDVVLGVATLGRDPVAAEFANLLSSGKSVVKAEAVGGLWRKEVK